MYQPSYWEQSTFFTNIDVCIVGSGIVGLCAALELKSKNPGLKVTVIESGFLPSGASTRNAGFACFGSLTELIADLKKETEAEVFNRVQMRRSGLKRLRELVGDKNLNYEHLGGYEIFSSGDDESYDEAVSRMNEINLILSKENGEKNIFVCADEKINDFGFKNTSHIILNRDEGQIDTGMMMKSLIDLANKNGIQIISGLSVKQLHSQINHVEIECENNYTFKAGKCLVATNGFAKKLLPDLNIEPARAQVLITKPINNLKIMGTFHYDEGFYYFRNVGERILLGGGRNLDFAKEKTTQLDITEKIQSKLDELLKNVILPDSQFEVDLRWSGIMGVGDSKSTIIKKINENVYCAVRLGGMGIAIGCIIGQKAAQMVLELEEPNSI